jgi:hypothetical protein
MHRPSMPPVATRRPLRVQLTPCTSTMPAPRPQSDVQGHRRTRPCTPVPDGAHGGGVAGEVTCHAARVKVPQDAVAVRAAGRQHRAPAVERHRQRLPILQVCVHRLPPGARPTERERERERGVVRTRLSVRHGRCTEAAAPPGPRESFAPADLGANKAKAARVSSLASIGGHSRTRPNAPSKVRLAIVDTDADADTSRQMTILEHSRLFWKTWSVRQACWRGAYGGLTVCTARARTQRHGVWLWRDGRARAMLPLHRGV